MTSLGVVVALGGLSGLFPGVKDVFIAVGVRISGAQNPEVPVYLAFGVMTFGILLVILDHFVVGREKAPGKNLIAFRHHSLQAVPAYPLVESDIPKRLRPCLLEHRECDQTLEMAYMVQDYDGALGVQERAWVGFVSRLQSTPRPDFAYYGVAHIPFQILMGCQLSQTSPLLLELSRLDRTWKELMQGTGPSLDLTVTNNKAKLIPFSAVIRISISYLVGMEDVRAIISEPYDDIEIRVKNIGIDNISHYSQIQKIVTAFRSVLDASTDRLLPGGEIHLFYAGPMSLGFSLGKVISPTSHPKVIAYNHTRQSNPRYSWGVTINSLDMASKVIRLGAAHP